MAPPFARSILAAWLASLGALPATLPVESAAAVADSAGTAPAPVFRPAEWETLSTGLPEAAHVRPVYGFRYNRVDGPAATAGAAVRTERAPNPLLQAQATYAFSRKRVLYLGGFEAPLMDPIRFLIAGSVYRRTATEDGWIVDELENTVFALLARTDYRDYYEAEGFEGHVAWQPGLDVELRVGARTEEQRSLSNETHFAVFGDEDEFRSNPPIEEGFDRVVILAARIGPASIPRDGGTMGDLVFERGGPPLDGDFDYARLRGAARTRLRLSPRQDARARVVGGSTVDGALPSQKVWHLGGISTLRGEEFQKVSGDQFLLANGEYYLLLRKNVWGFGFLDWGTAWFGRDNLPDQRFFLDGGIGIRIAEGPIALTAARNLQRSDAPILIGVRLGGTF